MFMKISNENYPVFKVDNPNEFEVWGVVIHQIRTFEKL